MSTCDKTRKQLKSLDKTRVIPCMLDKQVTVNGITIPVCEIEDDSLDITTFPQWMEEDNTPIGSGIKSIKEIKKLNKELYLKALTKASTTVPKAQWEIRIISFQQKLSLLGKFQDMFPDVPSRIQQAVNVRGVPTDKLYANNLISMSSYLSMTEGRKYHREINSLGAVGLAQANRIALLDYDSDNTNILLCEDDCQIKGQDKFKREISTLLSHTYSFDLAVFGGSIYNKTFSRVTVNELEAVPFMDDGWYYLDAKHDFFYTHCVLFTSRGRKIVGEHLMNERLEMQIDGLYSSMSRLNLIRVVIQLSNSTATQSPHFSSIQQGHCRLCSAAP